MMNVQAYKKWLAFFFMMGMSACSSCKEPPDSHKDTDSESEFANPSETKKCEPIRIAVLGDRTGHPDDEVFNDILKEIKRLSPDAIASVGDLIEGYQPDEKADETEAEWDVVLKRIQDQMGEMPMYFTAGNHDVWSDKSRAIFERRMHPVNATFDFGTCALIVFDTSRVERESEISEDDLNWLVHALLQYREKKARVVLTHRPLFAEKEGGAYGTKLHDVLIAGDATFVISGHWHHAMSDDRDDIQYRMIGTSGASPNREHHAESGNLAQFGWLVIDDAGAHFSIIKEGAVLPSDAFPYEMNQLEWRIENRAVVPIDFNIDPVRPASSGSFRVSFTNVTDDELVTSLSFADTSWKVSPGRRDIQLKPGRGREFLFSFARQRNDPLFPGPEVTASFPFFGTTYALTKSLAPTLRVRLTKASVPPVVDGDLGDAAWKRASPLGPFMEIRGEKMPYATFARAAVADNTLYLFFQMSDPDMEGAKPVGGAFLESGDHLLILLDDDPSLPGQRRIVVTPFGRVSDRQTQAESPVEEQPIHAAVVKNHEGWTAEIAVPLKASPDSKGPRTIGFNFARGRVRKDKSSKAYWQPLLEHDEESLGKLIW